MADVVQYRLERMVGELEDLERREIFTRSEIAEIVKQRRKFEYRLKRPSPLKSDYLAYIDYETQLDALRRLRKKASPTRGEKKSRRKTVSDFAGIAKILEIYRLAVMRYKGDIDLWFKYLEFCRLKKNGRMKKVLAQVIRFHPKVPGVWIYAAAWEFDNNLNVAAARALMQNGLRVCPTSEDLWVEYLRMELTYLNKLKVRKVALGEDKGSLVRDRKGVDEKQWKDENKELFMSLDEEKEKPNDLMAEDVDSDEIVDVFGEQGSNVVEAIYGGAVEALPSSLSLRKRVLEILEATDLANSEEQRKSILSDLKRDFSKDPEYWDWLAKHVVTDSKSNEDIDDNLRDSNLGKAIQVYEEAIEVLPSSSMFELYINFLMDTTGLENTHVIHSDSQTAKHVSHLLTVYAKAEKSQCLTEGLACKYVSFYSQLGRTNEACELAEKFCNGKFTDSGKLWLLRASIQFRMVLGKTSSSKTELQSLFDILKSVLTKISISEAESLWLMALKTFASQKAYFNKLVDISMNSVTKNGGSDDAFSLPSRIVNFVLQREGVQKARDIYKRFLALPRPGLVFYRDCIEMEANLASVGDVDCLSNARKLYESALATYDQNISLWRDYYSMETKLGTSETASAVYWRARKTLKDAAAFMESTGLL